MVLIQRGKEVNIITAPSFSFRINPKPMPTTWGTHCWLFLERSQSSHGTQRRGPGFQAIGGSVRGSPGVAQAEKEAHVGLVMELQGHEWGPPAAEERVDGAHCSLGGIGAGCGTAALGWGGHSCWWQKRGFSSHWTVQVTPITMAKCTQVHKRRVIHHGRNHGGCNRCPEPESLLGLLVCVGCDH